MKWAIIGGTGVYDPDLLSGITRETVSTPYGEVSYTAGDYQGDTVIFIPRHGEEHGVPPHKINYRANIWALASAGVKRIIATNAVGSLRERMAPGDVVMPDQFLDFTRGREATFFDGGPAGVVHVDVSEPYCARVAGIISDTGDAIGIRLHRSGTYVTTEGPRFETPAEINMFEQMGGDLVGMTSVPEAVLAREAGICYTSICIVTNYAAGMAGRPLSHEEVLAVLKENSERVRDLIAESIPRVPGDMACRCTEGAPGVPLPGLKKPES